MAGRCSPKSKIHFQLSSRSGQTTNLQSQSVADKIGNLSYGGRLRDNESTKSEKRDTVNKGRFIRPMKFINDDDDRSEDVDEASLLRQQQFSSQSEVSLDSELWNSQQEKEDDGSLMSKSSFLSVRTFDRVLPQFTTVSEQQRQKRQNNKNCATEKASGTEDKEKCKSEVNSKYEPAIEDPKHDVRTILTVYPEAGKGTSVKRSPAKIHISSEVREVESVATMKTLMNEFSDLTKKMSNLKQTLKSREPSPRSFKLKHSQPSSTNEISVITDVYGAKKIILDCIAELSVIKSFLDGNRRKTVDHCEESRKDDVEDHREEQDSHFPDQLERKSVVTTLTSELPCFEDTASKIKSDTVTVARTRSTRESLGFIKAMSSSRSKLDLLKNTPLNSPDNSQEKTKYETNTCQKIASVSPTSNVLETQDCVVIRSNVPSEVETTERNGAIKKIDEKIVDEDSKMNAEHKKSKKRKWYWCFVNCTRSSSPKRKDNLQSDRNDPASSCPDEGLQHDPASSKEVNSMLPYDKEGSKGLQSNVEHSGLSSASHVDYPLFSTNNLKDLSTNSFREQVFNNQVFRINSCRSWSKLMDYGQFPFFYNRHGLDEKNCKLFDKYNACGKEVNRDVKDFVKSCAGWTSQPDFNTIFRASAATNELFPVRCTNWNFAREPRRTKSVDFLYFDKPNSIFTVSNTKKMEVDLEEQRIEAIKDVDKSYPVKENVLKDVHQCLQNYLKCQRYRRSKNLKRISRSKSIKRLGVNSSANPGTSEEICCALQIICRKKKECGYHQSTRSECSRKASDDNDDEDRRKEYCRKIIQTDERNRTWMKSKLEDQQEHVGERLSVREKRNSDEIMTRQPEPQMKNTEPSTNTYLQNYSNFYVVQSIDASALKKSLFSEGQSHVLSSGTKASAKLSLSNDRTWNSKTFLCSGHSSAPWAPPYCIKKDSEDNITKQDSLVSRDRLSIEGMSVHRRECDDQGKQGMRIYKEVECKLKNNRDSCFERRTECCDFKNKLFDRIDRSKMVWALAKVNAFDDGSRTYEIIKTTPLPPGQKVNVSRANVIKVGKTSYCKNIR